MIRRKAICATAVMASASSNMISLKLPNDGVSPAFGAAEKICFVPNFLISRMLHVPLIANLRTSKRLDLFPNNIDASIITSIQLKYHLPYTLIAVDLPRQCQYR